MFKSSLKWFKALSKAGKAAVLFAGVVGLSAVASAANGTAPTNVQTPSTVQPQQLQTTVKPVITHKTVTTTEVVPFTSSNVNDNTLAQGTTKTTTAGVNGVRTHTFDVTYADGVETSRTETSTNVTTQPINQVIAVGTYVAPAAPAQPSCPNGTYINSAGNTVCSPYQSNSAPAGATAQCADGTYSFSQSRSGTCSHHGGVSTWL